MWEDRVWNIGDPGKSVWPQGGSAPDKDGGDPYPAGSLSCGACSGHRVSLYLQTGTRKSFRVRV